LQEWIRWRLTWIQVGQYGGSRTPAYTREAADPASHPQILVKRPKKRKDGCPFL
jgi:hypothetical protein